MIDVGTQHFGPRRFIRETRERLLGLRFEHFEAILQAPCLGAEIRGLDLREPLSSAHRDELERALVEFKVLFFRQQPLTAEQQADFARQFGELEIHPFIPDDGEHPEVAHFRKNEEVVGVENVWHSDVSWRQIPSLGSVLRAREVPPVGGDTMWCDMEAVYTGLPEPLRKRIEGRYAIHDFVHTFGHMLSPEDKEQRRKEFPPAAHPIVRRHPVSGRRCLYVNPVFTSHVDGLPEAESDALLSELYSHARVPEYQVRFRWEADSIAFWDNRSTQHYAISDYWPLPRVMDRITIIGDEPRQA